MQQLVAAARCSKTDRSLQINNDSDVQKIARIVCSKFATLNTLTSIVKLMTQKRVVISAISKQ
jgi:hypothetical protein